MLDYGWKRLFSGLLAFVLVIGMLPPVTVAAEETDATETTEIMEVLETEPAITEPVITEPVETTVATEAVTEPAETTAATEETVAEATEATEPEETVAETIEETVAETTEETEAFLPENVAAVQALIDALPTVDSVTAEDYEAVQAAFDAYEALTEEEKTLIQGAEVFEGLFGWFNAQVSTLDTFEWGILDGGVMTIHGTVPIPDYPSAESTPWYDDRLSITEIIIDEGITAIGDHAFDGFYNLTTVTIPNSVTVIGEKAFYECFALKDISIPDKVITIGHAAFAYCKNLTNVTIPQGLASIGDNMFYMCTGLTSVTLPYGVTSIGLNAFMNCTFLASVTIPASVTSIGNQAFDLCNSLTDVYYTGTQAQWEAVAIGAGNTGLNTAAIHYSYTAPSDIVVDSGMCGLNVNWSLRDNGHLVISGIGNMSNYTYQTEAPWYSKRNSIAAVTIQSGVTSIGDRAFHSCKNLISVSVPKSVVTIGKRVFYDCNNLTSVNIPEGVTSINELVFQYCRSLTSITLPESLVTIGVQAFTGCSNLTSITIPEGVTTIDNGAFSSCSKLASINIPDGVTVIASSVFSGCSSLTSITIPDGVTSIGTNAFLNCSKLTSITIPEGVTSIGNTAFYKCNNLTSITIPKSVTSIGDYAFYECNKLASIAIPKNVTSIGAYAFYDCNKLTSVTIPDGVTSIGNYTFYNCYELASVTLPDGITSIGDYAFRGCNDITALKLPTSLTSIGEYAFFACSDLTTSLPEGVISIGDNAFSACYALTSITIPASVTSIGERVFSSCSKLTEILVAEGNENYTSIDGVLYDIGVTKVVSAPEAISGSLILPNGLITIGDLSFASCRKLTSITIPESVTSIGNYVFCECSGLTSVTIPVGITTISDYMFYGCKNLTSITIPESATSIGDQAFEHCSSLTSITIPEGVTYIDREAFFRCSSLTSVTIPVSLTRIDAHVFYHCESLTDAYYAGTIAQWNSIAIERGNDYLTNASIHCTDGIINERAVPEIRPAEKVQLLSGNSKQFSAYDSKTGNKITVTWKVTKGAEYATITADGKLTAKNVTQARTVTISATDSAGGTGTKTITILPKATSVGISWGVEYVSLDLSESENPTVQLTSTTYPEDALDDVKWSTSDKTIATVDENGLVTLLKPGTATIKVTTTDGSNKSSSVKLTVYYVDTATKLTATAEVPTIGLQPGQTAKITVTGSKELPQDKLSFSIPANQQHIATVDENTGIVTAGDTPGTVTVTAAIRNDPLKRTATVKIKVIDMQAASLEVSADVGETAKFEENTVILDALTVKDNAYTFTVSATGKNHKDEPFTPAVTWASSNTAIATVKTDKDGITTVTVKKGAGGECAITATAKDLGKVSASLWLSVRDYQPRLESSSLSMNLYQSSSVDVALMASYGNQITDVSIDGDFDADWNNGLLTITAQDSITKGNYTPTLTVTCENEATYEYPLKIKVTETAPTVTIKQSGKYNLFYSDGTATLTFTAKDGAVNNVTVRNDDFEGKYENGVLTLTCKNVANPNKKVDLQIEVEGYEKPVEKTVTLATVTTAPKLKLSSASSTINTNYGSQSTSFQVLEGTDVLPLEEKDVAYSGDFAKYSVAENAITLTLVGNKGGTATLNIQKENWTKSVKLTHKITVQTALPTLKLNPTTLKLNSVFPEQEAETTVSLSQANLELDDMDIISKTNGADNVLDVDFVDGKIVAKIKEDSADSIKAGTYTYTCTGYIGETELKPVTLKVTVSATSPKVKLASTTFKLNRELYGQESISTKVTVPDGYTLVRFDGGEDFFSYEDGYLTASLNSTEDVGGTFTIYPVLLPKDCEESITLSTGLKVKITTYSGEISATISTKGKLDTLNPDSAITYTVKLKNCAGTISDDISLSGQDEDLFDVKVQNGNVILTMKNGKDYATNKTYKVNLDMIACGQEVSKAISFKVSQSALKLTATPSTLTCYQAIGYGTTTLKITSPATAEIADVTLGSQTTAALQKALGEDGLDYDFETGKVTLTLQNPGLLTPGKSYTLYLDVTPKGNAENVKPTQVKLTVKVKS